MTARQSKRLGDLARGGDHGARAKLFALSVLLAAALGLGPLAIGAQAAPLLAGVAKVDITNNEAGPANDRLYAKALVLQSGDLKTAIVTIDAVAIGEIGTIGNDYLPTVRARIEKQLHIPPLHVMINASHCHGVVCTDVAERTVEAVQKAAAHLVPVRVGVARAAKIGSWRTDG